MLLQFLMEFWKLICYDAENNYCNQKLFKNYIPVGIQSNEQHV